MMASKMDIKIEYFDKLPKCYQEVAIELMANLARAKTLEEKRNLFEEFQTRYTLIPPLWSLWIENETGTKKSNIEKKAVKKFPCSKFLKEISVHCIYRAYLYYSNININDVVTENWNSFKESENEFFIPEISYPHDFLNGMFKLYDEACSETPANLLKVHQKNLELYEELKSSLNDPIRFFDAAIKSTDKKSIKKNLSIILGDHPYSVELWNKCFKYFEENNPSKLLSLYNKYCGIFLDDEEAIKNRDKLKLANLVVVKKSLKLSIPPKSTTSLIFKNLTTLNNVRFQCMSFQKPIRNYIYENANAKIATKLMKAAKHFIQVFPYNIIRRLEISSDNSKDVYKFALKIPPTMVEKLPKIWLSNSLLIPYGVINNDIVSTLASKITKCDLKYIRIFSQNITLNEFKILTKSGNVEALLFLFGDILDSNDVAVPLEDILPHVLKVYSLTLSPCHFTPKTFETILKLKLKNKLIYIELSGIDEFSNVDFLIEFFKKNLGPFATVNLNLNDDLSYEMSLVSPNFKEFEEAWIPYQEKPDININLD